MNYPLIFQNPAYALCSIKVLDYIVESETLTTDEEILDISTSEYALSYLDSILFLHIYVYVTGSAKTSNFTENIKLRKD